MPTLKMKLVFTMARQAEALNLQIVAYHGYGDMWTWGHVDMCTCAHVDMWTWENVDMGTCRKNGLGHPVFVMYFVRK